MAIAEHIKDERPFIIYALTDPRTLEVRYIGQTVAPRVRYKTHLWTAKRGAPTYKDRWLRELNVAGLEPIFNVLETTTDNERNPCEIQWIAYFRSIDAPLTNLASGGGGISGFKRTSEFCALLSKINTGKRPSPETIRKLSESHKGKPGYWKGKHLPDHVRAAISASKKGRKGTPHSAESRAKLSAAHIGKPSPHRGRIHSEEARINMSAAQKLFAKLHPRQPRGACSAETKAHISEAVRKGWPTSNRKFNQERIS